MRRPALPSPARREAQRRLAGKTGRQFWRSLDELSGDPVFDAAITAEFPSAFEGVSELGRRQVLKAMAASLGLAGLAACSDQPNEQALPYVHQPEFIVPDKARHYATAVVGVGGYAQPVLGATYEGRPTKLDGLPGHPCSLGAADAFTQAAILGLYDPDRSQTPRFQGRPADWDAFDAAMLANARRLDETEGDGFRLLSGQETSPTFARQWGEIAMRWPKARRHVLEAANDDLRIAAAMAAFGRPLQVLPQLDRAEVVVSLEDDLLGPGPAQTRNARLWAQRRQAFQRGEGASRLFTAEPTPTLTGAMSEARLPVGHARIAVIAQALGAQLGVGPGPAGLSAAEQGWVQKAAAALVKAGPDGLVTVGAQQPPAVQALGFALNARLGSTGRTFGLIEPVAVRPDGDGSLDALLADMHAGRVDTLVVLDANPAYARPGFADALKRVRFSLHAGLALDETAASALWHAPIEHGLETWTDARAVDGAASVIQPLVKPFYSVRSRHQILEAVQGKLDADPHELVAATWRATWADGFDARWADALRKGFVDGSAAMPVDAQPAAAPSPAPPAEPADLELIVRPDPCIWDGRFANNPLLQELPKPINTVAWDNVLSVSPALARRMDLKTGEVVRVGDVAAPVWITPGQAERTVTAYLGYGRRLPHQVGDGHGYDASSLRPGPVSLAKTGDKRTLAAAQDFQTLEGGDFVRTVAAEEARKPKTKEPDRPSFYRDEPYDSPSWGMSIDTDLCIGCNACVTACDTENNIAMVGKDQAALGRTMHWLRIDHYYEGDPAAPSDYFQPVPCMHCEQAPCEIGCPVNATVHSPDGLNLQVYNRCIGTRTCSSYCPYKVRHFNWFDWTENDTAERQASRNPNVTVRSRGVMEKCTYCIQRVSAARIQAKIENRPIREGEVKTACQQTCPTDAIVFGDVTDKASAVSKKKAQARDYALLEDANTRPRTTYLARLKSGEEG